MNQIFIESSIIICVGLFMHIYSIRIVDISYSKWPLLAPNTASSIFALSVLGVFIKLRTFIPRTVRKPQRFLIFVLELVMILYATDFVLRRIWLPSLKLLNLMCYFLGQYIIRANMNFLIYNAPQLSSWIRNDAFYTSRLLLAIITFIVMINVTGFVKILQRKSFSDQDNKIVDLTNNGNYSIKRKSFDDVYELPYLPQENLLNLARRARTRRQNTGPKNKGKNKVLLYDETQC